MALPSASTCKTIWTKFTWNVMNFRLRLNIFSLLTFSLLKFAFTSDPSGYGTQLKNMLDIVSVAVFIITLVTC